MRLLRTYRSTISDGPGLRYAIYLAGCRHACKGCHNPLSWDPSNGIELSESVLDTLVQEILSDPLLDGITISGGDPFYNPRELLSLLRHIGTRISLPIWVYTGYTIEEVARDPVMSRALPYIDTLVDGRFVRSLYDPYLEWRGSANQRIIRVEDWLASHPGLEEEFRLSGNPIECID